MKVILKMTQEELRVSIAKARLSWAEESEEGKVVIDTRRCDGAMLQRIVAPFWWQQGEKATPDRKQSAWEAHFIFGSLRGADPTEDISCAWDLWREMQGLSLERTFYAGEPDGHMALWHPAKMELHGQQRTFGPTPQLAICLAYYQWKTGICVAIATNQSRKPKENTF